MADGQPSALGTGCHPGSETSVGLPWEQTMYVRRSYMRSEPYHDELYTFRGDTKQRRHRRNGGSSCAMDERRCGHDMMIAISTCGSRVRIILSGRSSSREACTASRGERSACSSLGFLDLFLASMFSATTFAFRHTFGICCCLRQSLSMSRSQNREVGPKHLIISLDVIQRRGFAVFEERYGVLLWYGCAVGYDRL